MLTGVRVLDFTRVMSGPYCTAMLADLGAEARRFGPQLKDHSACFLLPNRGKLSVTVNLKTAEGRALVGKLAAKSDVMIENFRPGTGERRGVGYDAMAARNPWLIYASINGFVADGPLANRPALHLAIQAMNGLTSMTGSADGPPMAVGESIADVATGIFAACGITAALYEREHSGKGRHIRSSNDGFDVRDHADHRCAFFELCSAQPER